MFQKNITTSAAKSFFRASTILLVLSGKYLDPPEYGTDTKKLTMELGCLIRHMTGIKQLPEETWPIFRAFLQNEILNQHPLFKKLSLEVLGEQIDLKDTLKRFGRELGIPENEIVSMGTVPKEKVREEVKRLHDLQLLDEKRTDYLLEQLK
ncbi:hypothetical protein EXS61_00385 [Candidatus Parcubacteria bacterium]|nr:hypothetical protein [Candidatus Parcubacteria bacterium]